MAQFLLSHSQGVSAVWAALNASTARGRLLLRLPQSPQRMQPVPPIVTKGFELSGIYIRVPFFPVMPSWPFFGETDGHRY
jgi:hypothetical protein